MLGLRPSIVQLRMLDIIVHNYFQNIKNSDEKSTTEIAIEKGYDNIATLLLFKFTNVKRCRDFVRPIE